MTWRPRRRRLPYTPRTRLFLGLAGSSAFALLGLWQRASGESTWTVSFGVSIFLYVIASYSYWRSTR